MISVCIPTYNGEKYLNMQLDSILAQLGQEDEIIISDDSSTDNTINIIESYNDSRIRLLKKNNYKSPTFNLENALSRAKGEYIFLSDQDDIWKKNKVTFCLNRLIHFDLVLSNAEIINENGELIRISFHTEHLSSSLLKNLHHNPYIGSCMAFKKNILDIALPFPKGIAMHDSWIGLLAQLTGTVSYINEPLIQYRRHQSNVSSSGEESPNSLIFKIRYRIVLVIEIIKRLYFSKKQ